MAVREYTEGFYWLKRTAKPLEIGGRSRWIGYYNGFIWQTMGSPTQYTTDKMLTTDTEILERIDEPA
jgi:hypothetical protein